MKLVNLQSYKKKTETKLQILSFEKLQYSTVQTRLHRVYRYL